MRYNEQKFQMIIPSTVKDYKRNKRDLSTFFELLPVREIVFIGPSELEALVRAYVGIEGTNGNVRYVNENDILPYKKISDCLISKVERAGYTLSANSKVGWYYQQFLKMAYALKCPDDYYISWDSDTIPLRKISMFNEEGKPYFDIKPEYIPSYFNTIKSLFGIDKIIKGSFISEHMIFNKVYMKAMIEEMEELDFDGDLFYEKIINAMKIEDMVQGFSEFETFGTWMTTKHSGVYAFREWHSMRMAGHFFNPADFTAEDREWLAKDFDAATFESYNPVIEELYELFHTPEYRITMSPKEIYDIILKSDLFAKQDDGRIMPN